MSVSTRLAVFAALSLPVAAALPLDPALAQTSPAPDTATLLKRIEEQDKKIEALEHKLELLEEQQAAAGNAPAGSPAAAPNAGTPAGAGAPPGAPSTAVQGATAAVSQGQVAGQPGAPKAPPVPQTTGALPGSPSTAVQGATAAVSQRAGTANQAPGLVSAGSIKAGPTGFSFSSADNSNVIRFRGNLAVDGRWYMDHGTPESDD